MPEAQIVKLAELMAANRTMLMAGWGMQRQQFGEQKHWMIVTLAAMLGKSAHPAAVLVFLTILPMVVTPRAALRCSLPCRAACRVAPMR